MPVFEIGLEDGRTLEIEAVDQEAALAGVAHFQSTQTTPKTNKSAFDYAADAAEGVGQGFREMYQGGKETAQQVAGVGPGRGPADPNYTPADPYNIRDWPKLVGEQLPGLTSGVAAGYAASKAVKGSKRAQALAGLLAGTGVGMGITTGDTIAERTKARTGDENAESSLTDKVVGGGTAAAASMAQAALPTRFIPGLTNYAGRVGLKGAGDAITRGAATVGVGGAGNLVGDLVTQAGTTAGTEQGLTIDPKRAGAALITGAVTGAAGATPKVASDMARAGLLRKYGGKNQQATENYATRLETAGEGKLGSATVDAEAQKNTVKDIRTELSGAIKNVRDQIAPSEDVNNVLTRASEGQRLSAKDVDLLDRSLSAAPDGKNAAFLARTLHVAQMNQKRGSYSDERWAGGISGATEDRIRRLPLVAGAGALAGMTGAHLAGMASPQFAGAAFGLYGGAYLLDKMTGLRSPAKTMADHFANRDAALRLAGKAPPDDDNDPNTIGPWSPKPKNAYSPTGQRAPQAPEGGAQGPWGERPLPQQSVPQTGPSAPPVNPQADANYKAMVQQAFGENDQRDANYKAMVEQAFSENAARNAALLNATKQDNANFKVNVAQASSENKARDMMAAMALKQDNANYKANVQQAFSENKTGNADFRANQVQAESENRDLNRSAADDAKAEAQQAREAQRAEDRAAREQAKQEAKAQTAAQRAQAQAERAARVAQAAAAKAEQAKAKEAAKLELVKAREAAKVETAKAKLAAIALKNARRPATAASLSSAATPAEAPKSIGDILNRLQAEEAPAKPKKVTKTNGKVEADEPSAPYEPLPEDALYPKGIKPDAYAELELARYRRPEYSQAQANKYKLFAEQSETARRSLIDPLIEKFPSQAHIFNWLLRELQQVSKNKELAKGAVDYAVENLTDDAAKALRAKFK
jgi:hypothetical protein